MIETHDVQIEVINHIGIIKLNRKKALNALSLPMIEKISYYLNVWEDDPNIYLIYLKSIVDKVFCAGGDVKSLYLNNQTYKDEYLAKQYLMDYHFHTYKKPVISYLDGIVFGGGVGLGLSASHVVISKHVRLAMPETKIGFFPDVGTTRLLNDLPYNIGTYLGLLGVELDYKDISYLKLSNYVIDSNENQLMEHDLYEYEFEKKSIKHQIDEILSKYHIDDKDDSSIKIEEVDIKRVFSKPSISMMYNTLEENKWDQDIKKKFESQSPTALHVTLELLKRTKDMSLYECFKTEHDLSRHVVHTHDFNEGVRSLLVDKDKRFLYSPVHIKNVDKKEIDKLFDFSTFEPPHIMDKLKDFDR